MTRNLSGQLLIASPYLTDRNFMRSVVFMIRHDDEGAFGLAINRPTSTRLRDVIGATGLKGEQREDDAIFRGGPVEGPLLALHDLAGVGEPCGGCQQTSAGLQEMEAKCTIHEHPDEPWGSMSIELGNPPAWITGDDDHLRILLHRPDARVRYVAHYSGWGAGQLDGELQAGGWLVGEPDSEILFGDYNECWELAVRRCGHEILRGVIPTFRTGDPERN